MEKVTADSPNLAIPSRFIISDPFLSVAYHGNNKELRFLLSKGINPNMTDSDGMSALHLASYNGNSQTTVLLVESGANLDLQDNAGWTPLLWSVKMNQTRVAHLLLEAGCDVNILDNMNLTALDWAYQAGDKQIIKMLLDHGATANSTNSHEKLSQIKQDTKSPTEGNKLSIDDSAALLSGIIDNTVLQTGILKTTHDNDISRKEDDHAVHAVLDKQPEIREPFISISNALSPNKPTLQSFPDTLKVDLINLGSEQYEATPCTVPCHHIPSPGKVDLNQWFESQLDNSHEDNEKIEAMVEDLRQQLVESEANRCKMASTIVDLESQLSRSKYLYQESNKQVQELNKLQSKLLHLNQEYDSKIFSLESQLSDANSMKSNLHHDLHFAETQVRELQRMNLEYFSQIESKEKALQISESQRIEALTNLEKSEYERKNIEMKKSIEITTGKSRDPERKRGGDHSPVSPQDTVSMLENYKNQVSATQDILLATQRQQILSQKRFEETQRTLVITQERLELSQLQLADTLNQLQSLELQQLTIRKSYEEDAIETLQKLAETQAALSDSQQHFEDCQAHLADVKTQLADSRCHLLEKKLELADAKRELLARSKQLEEYDTRKDSNIAATEKDNLIIKLENELSLLKEDNQLLNTAIATKQGQLIEYDDRNKELTSKLTKASTDLSSAFDRLHDSTSTLTEKDQTISSLRSQISELTQKVEWTLQQLAAQHQRVYNQITTHKAESPAIESIRDPPLSAPSPGSPFPVPLFPADNASRYFSPPDGYSTPRRAPFRPPSLLHDTANTMTTIASSLSPSSPIYHQENNDTPKLSPSSPSVSTSLDTSTEIEVARQRLVHMEEELYTANMTLLGSLDNNRQLSSQLKQLEAHKQDLLASLDCLNLKYSLNASLLKEAQDQLVTFKSDLLANNILLADRDRELLCSRKTTMALRSKLKSTEVKLQEEIMKCSQSQSRPEEVIGLSTSPVTTTSTSCNTDLTMNVAAFTEGLLGGGKSPSVSSPSSDTSEVLKNQLVTSQLKISELQELLRTQEACLSQAERQVRDYKNYYVHCAAELKELKTASVPPAKVKPTNSTGRSSASESRGAESTDLVNKLREIMSSNKSVLSTSSNKENIAKQMSSSHTSALTSGGAATGKMLRTPPPSVGLGCVWPEL